MTERKVTLEDVLDCREKRAERQKETLSRFGAPVVSITLVWPGEVKDTEASRYAMEQATRSLDDVLDALSISPNLRRCDFLVTGAEAIYSVNMDATALKRLCVGLEEAHPLGRLWDIDVIGADGRPISRTEVGLSPRSCLVCDEPAHVCARSRAHDVSELLSAIHRSIDEFKQSLEAEE
ncbi:phosphoribosyl-dephospho-CoA transferase [Leminorella grimontii]|uniref:Apo-citrate lyase phosphoribosyl-dephospho-CoA transferase n=1 Tax=Leminorella grimontii TaxID=82981 RepID=A0AAV5MZI7_9GAMM|nr:citrate lyase holo-[acyl-carrier protein] synthase [Leminorella grimontii]KFC97374.1 apo-citrate lyase phosphoribosyl-dephospho-CoA transferase [Leminorella grimontii ATCC 33999 = DSM 5078]GKX55271.1 phosphoribosyl-dephospho-CoA transferase [Leminorella grimontii]VFS56693.1 2'-(5''-triphosphoribosyl)-3'-dephospho-CoA:apo-citrate lyase [Leminorella grimontii]